MCQRVFSFIEKNCDSKIPKFKNFFKEDEIILNDLTSKIQKIKDHINNQELNLYIKEVINFSFNANKYFNDMQPWKLKKTNIERMNAVIYTILNQIRSISILLNPIIPISSNKILSALGITNKDITIDKLSNIKFLTPNSKIKKVNILFKKIENDN